MIDILRKKVCTVSNCYFFRLIISLSLSVGFIGCYPIYVEKVPDDPSSGYQPFYSQPSSPKSQYQPTYRSLFSGIKVRCHRCNGTGMISSESTITTPTTIPCLYCNSTGQVKSKFQCYVCGGAGKCSDCDGVGYKIDYKKWEPPPDVTCIAGDCSNIVGIKRPCRRCGGTGKCPSCAGKGYIREDWIPCSKCDGKGYLQTGTQTTKSTTQIPCPVCSGSGEVEQ